MSADETYYLIVDEWQCDIETAERFAERHFSRDTYGFIQPHCMAYWAKMDEQGVMHRSDRIAWKTPQEDATHVVFYETKIVPDWSNEYSQLKTL